MNRSAQVVYKIGVFLVVVTGIIYFCASCIPDGYAVTIQLNKTKIRLQLSPGQAKTENIVIMNPEDEPLSVKVYTMDWLYDSVGDGSKSFFPPGSQSRSCSKWINLYPEKVEVPPRGAAEVKYTITVPEDAEGGHYSVIFFETELGMAKDREGNYFKLGARMGTLILQEDAQTSDRSAKVTDFDVFYDGSDESINIKYTLNNTGNADIVLRGNYNIIDSEGNLFGRGGMKEVYTLPDGSGKAFAKWEGILPAGEYDVMVTLDLGDDKIITKEKRVAVSKGISVEGLSLTAGQAGKELLAKVKSVSNDAITVKGQMTIRKEQDDEIIGTYPVDAFILEPKGIQEIRIPIQDTPAGSYSAVLELVYGSKRIEKELPLLIE